MIEEVLTQLRAELCDEFTRIDYAFEAEPFEKMGDEIPALLLFPARFEADRRASDNRVDQREDQMLGVQLVTKVADFSADRRKLNAELMGYQFAPEARMFELVEGEPMGIRGGLIWFQFIYRTNAPVGL